MWFREWSVAVMEVERMDGPNIRPPTLNIGQGAHGQRTDGSTIPPLWGLGNHDRPVHLRGFFPLQA